MALTEILPEGKLRRRRVGAVVESLRSDVFDVEFGDDDGRTFARVGRKRDTWSPVFKFESGCRKELFLIGRCRKCGM